MDEEILQDFLVEATELLDQLNEQLVDLENSPDDANLLNSIFRGFHTIKGGAGFLGVMPLVEVCHRAENVFDKIRNQDVAYDAAVADVILRAFDQISKMIGALNDGERELENSDGSLLAELDALTKPGAATVEVEKPAEGVVALQLPEGVDPDGDITDDEFEALLSQREQIGGGSAPSATPDVTLQLPEGMDPDGEISDDEFEALLAQRDQLLGEDEPVSAPAPVVKPVAKPAPAAPKKPPVDSDDKADAEKAAAKNTTKSTVRVDTRRLDEIMNLVGELVLVRNRLLTLRSSEASPDEISKDRKSVV